MDGQEKEKKRIGIFSGSFDPVHKGHISFALIAMEAASLDEVYLLPETRPRHKPSVSHISHRVGMLTLASRPYKGLRVLELADKQFSVTTTLPRLRQKFPDTDLVLLLGSDAVLHLHAWPHVQELLKHVGLVVAVRSEAEVSTIMECIVRLDIPLKELHVIESFEPHIASKNIRQAIRQGKSTSDVVKSVHTYAKEHWLYESISASKE